MNIISKLSFLKKYFNLDSFNNIAIRELGDKCSSSYDKIKWRMRLKLILYFYFLFFSRYGVEIGATNTRFSMTRKRKQKNLAAFLSFYGNPTFGSKNKQIRSNLFFWHFWKRLCGCYIFRLLVRSKQSISHKNCCGSGVSAKTTHTKKWANRN